MRVLKTFSKSYFIRLLPQNKGENMGIISAWQCNFTFRNSCFLLLLLLFYTATYFFSLLRGKKLCITFEFQAPKHRGANSGQHNFNFALLYCFFIYYHYIMSSYTKGLGIDWWFWFSTAAAVACKSKKLA